MRKIVKILLVVMVALCYRCYCYAQSDTLWVSDIYTSHVIFDTDLTYVDLSNGMIVAAKIIEQNRNMLAIKGREAFTSLTSVSALESNGRIHTFIVGYDASPLTLIRDMRANALSDGRQVSLNRSSDAPLLSDMVIMDQQLYHIGDRKHGIIVLCEEIMSYSDITYVVLSIDNRSGVSYETKDATLVIESRRKGKRTVHFEKTIFPNGRHGSLSVKSGGTAKIAYSLPKMTLSDDQVLKIYLYEDNGQRNLEMTVSAKDINSSGKSKR